MKKWHLDRFISQAIDKCIPLFNIIRKKKRFKWSEDCLKAFQDLKNHLEKLSILSGHVNGESLYLYVAVFEHVVS